MTEEQKSCDTCENKAMDMDMDPYCAAVNHPWGATLCRGKPKECGPESLLWKKDGRRRLFGETFPPKPEPVTSEDGNTRRQGDT